LHVSLRILNPQNFGYKADVRIEIKKTAKACAAYTRACASIRKK